MGTNQSTKKQDLIHIAILLSVAVVIGVYLIATTILIAKDGVDYIERAQQFPSDPIGIIKAHPPGYPVLIFLAHKLVALFSNSSSVQTWIYSAQGVSLLCRILSLVPLYFIGKMLVGARNSFRAILILIMLPYPARFGSDVLRDWPHILFLAMGFLLLLWGAKQGKWWIFGIAGLVAGLGCVIRPECAQLVVYGTLWLLIRLLKPKYNMSRPKLLCALFILLIGFTLPVVPYVIETGRIIPPKLGGLIDSSKEHIAGSHSYIYTIVNLLGNVTQAIGRLIEEISDNLMYFFVPALLIGFYCRFCKQSMATDIERFFVPAFIVFNVIMMILLYCNSGYISRRHVLPLVVFTIFYVQVGLLVLGDWLMGRFSKSPSGTNKNPQLWFFVLVIAGLSICAPKLLRPMRIEKQGYLDASRWLKENTKPEDIIAVPDRRLYFYAERKGLIYNKAVPKQAKYVVRIVKDEDKKPKFDRTVKKEYSVCVDKRKKSEKRLVIYKMM